METLPVRRIHIDSRMKTDNSDSHSDFHIRLGLSVTLPEDCICMVDNISIPNTFFTVQAGVNDSLYIAEEIYTNHVVCRKITLRENYYTSSQFAQELAFSLNMDSPTVMNVNPYTAEYKPQQGHVLVTVTAGFEFVILSDEQIQNFPSAGYQSQSAAGNILKIDKNFPNSANGILRNVSNGDKSGDPSTYILASSYKSGYLDLQPVHNCFIHSNLADNCVMTPKGMSDCIACCPISASTGIMVHHNVTSHADAINVSKRSFDTLSFQLRNAKGQIVYLNGASWSCSLLFIQNF
jgi:hypothetical protein